MHILGVSCESCSITLIWRSVRNCPAWSCSFRLIAYLCGWVREWSLSFCCCRVVKLGSSCKGEMLSAEIVFCSGAFLSCFGAVGFFPCISGQICSTYVIFAVPCRPHPQAPEVQDYQPWACWSNSCCVQCCHPGVLDS